MGKQVYDSIPDEIYSLGFTSGEGFTAWCTRPESYPIEKANKESLEALFDSCGYENAFLDFKNLPANSFLRRPLEARPFGYTSENRIWPDFFDGMFYTKTMKRSTFREFHNNGSVKKICYYDSRQNVTSAVQFDEDGNRIKETFFKKGRQTSVKDYGNKK